MRKSIRWKAVALAAMLSGSLTACQPTPKEVAIQPKGNLEQVIQNNESKSSDEKIMNQVKAEATSKFEVKSSDEKINIKVDADVIVPDVAKAPVYQVIRNDFTDNDVDRITKVFFGDSDLYPEITYQNMTKDELLQQIAEIQKQYDNIDPEYKEAAEKKYGSALELLQSYVDKAPETIKREPYKEYKLEKDEDTSAIGEYRYFSARGKLGDLTAHIYFQLSDSYVGVNLYKDDPDGLANYTRSSIISLDGKEAAEMENTCKYSEKEAVALTDDVMKQLGLNKNYACYSVEDSARGTRSIGAVSSYTGYQVIYLRTIDGIQETDDIYNGTLTEDEETDSVPYGTERIYFIVSDQGIMQFSWDSPMKLGEKQADNVNLKEYKEIEEVFKKHVLIKFAGRDENSEEKLPSVINVSEIRLGYMRVKNKNKQDEFTMVPVWDFISDLYGKSSILTVNAIDGSVLDRRYGY